MASPSRIPVLVVSGFLGAGKTTLVARLLDQARREGERLAVISNELGAPGIDRALLGAGVPLRELEGGCVCCALSNELVETLEALRVEVAPDRIVIETSGAALPYDVQLSLWRPPVSEWLGDDMAVVVVNAEQVAARRELGPTFEQQVSAADLLLLNQIDRVPGHALEGLEALLREIEPEASIVRCRHADVEPALLRPPVPPDGSPAARRPAPARAPHVHEDFETCVLEIEPGIGSAALVERLRTLGALRAKGWVETAEGTRLVQGVGRRIELEARAVPESAHAGRLVVIRRADRHPERRDRRTPGRAGREGR
jgi:G3E family GTPase